MTRDTSTRTLGRLLCGLSAVLICAAAGGRGAGAQITEPETWRFQCMSDGHSDEEEICTTEITASQDGDDFLIYFVHSDKGADSLVVDGIEVPFVAAVITVDDKEPIATERCEDGTCFYEPEVSRTLLKQFRRGRKARIQVRSEDQRLRLDREITLRGFSAAFDKYRTRVR